MDSKLNTNPIEMFTTISQHAIQFKVLESILASVKESFSSAALANSLESAGMAGSDARASTTPLQVVRESSLARPKALYPPPS